MHIAWQSTKKLLSFLLPTIFPSLIHIHLVAHLAQDPIKGCLYLHKLFAGLESCECPGGTLRSSPRLGSSGSSLLA